MAASFAIGGTLVSSDELSEKHALGEIGRFVTEARTNPAATIDFSGGRVAAADVPAVAAGATLAAAGAAAPAADVPDFTPIGIGKPLSIEILTVYTGDAPGAGLFGGKPDLLVASGVRGIETFDAAPRAIHQIVEDIEDRRLVEPSALNPGSPVVYYTPAVVNSTILCTLELVADSFDESTFQRLSALFGSAAKLPVFAPASQYLIAGSFLTKIFEDLGKALLESDPFLRAELPLRFDTPDIPVALARHVVLYNDRDARELARFAPERTDAGAGQQRIVLLDRDTRKAYEGNAPYIVASLDGRRRPDLDGYTPKLASAAILEKFYGASDTGGQTVEALGSALELYNDFTFREKAERLRVRLDSLDPESAAFADAARLYAAYAGNIRNDLFKVQPVGEAAPAKP